MGIYRGDSFRHTITINDADGDPIDLTDCTGEADLKTSAGTVVDSFNVVTGGTDGTITLTLTKTQARALPVGILHSDIEVSYGSEAITYAVFVFQVKADVTITD